MAFPHSDFERAFLAGQVFVCPRRGRIVCVPVPIGDLVLPTGRIIAADPTGLQFKKDHSPFLRTVPPGKYPATLCKASMTWSDGRPEDRIACAKVQFRDGEISRWEMALCRGQNLAELPKGSFFTYGVDAGTGCFVDAIALETLSNNELDEWAFRRLTEVYQQDPLHRRTWVSLDLPGCDGANLVAFDSGYGDGSYPSYWGLDKDDQPVCLVTDFQLLVEPVEHSITLSSIPELLGRTMDHPDLADRGMTVTLLHQHEVVADKPELREALTLKAREYESTADTSGFSALASFMLEQAKELKRTMSLSAKPWDGQSLVIVSAGDSCDAKVYNAGKEYQRLQFEDPLQADARLVIRLSDGVRSLPTTEDR